jgi:hypothetical protein
MSAFLLSATIEEYSDSMTFDSFIVLSRDEIIFDRLDNTDCSDEISFESYLREK